MLDAEQLKVLNETYSRTAFPTTEERNELAKKLGMSARSVQIWSVFILSDHLISELISDYVMSLGSKTSVKPCAKVLDRHPTPRHMPRQSHLLQVLLLALPSRDRRRLHRVGHTIFHKEVLWARSAWLVRCMAVASTAIELPCPLRLLVNTGAGVTTIVIGGRPKGHLVAHAEVLFFITASSIFKHYVHA
jgi:hypothetical protein